MNKTIPISDGGLLLSIAKEKPAEAYQAPLKAIVADILETLGPKNVRSIVLRGSVACHTDLPGISDLDLVIFLRDHSGEACAQLEALAARETERWRALVPLVDLSCERFDRLTTDIFYNRLYLNLKLTGITLWGEDLIALLPDIAFDRALAGRIARQTWLESLQTFRLISRKQTVPFMGESRGCDFLCVWFMRSFCRGLIAMVMLKRRIFSLHVQTCADLFGEQFPQYAPLAKRCRELECAPTKDWEQLAATAAEALRAYEALCGELSLEEVIYGAE